MSRIKIEPQNMFDRRKTGCPGSTHASIRSKNPPVPLAYPRSPGLLVFALNLTDQTELRPPPAYKILVPLIAFLLKLVNTVPFSKLTMTHYYALRNQPRMKLQNADARNLHFMFVGGSNIDPMKDAYMRSLTISFVDKDHIIQKWTLFVGGKEKGTSVFELSRVL